MHLLSGLCRVMFQHPATQFCPSFAKTVTIDPSICCGSGIEGLHVYGQKHRSPVTNDSKEDSVNFVTIGYRKMYHQAIRENQ